MGGAYVQGTFWLPLGFPELFEDVLRLGALEVVESQELDEAEDAVLWEDADAVGGLGEED